MTLIKNEFTRMIKRNWDNFWLGRRHSGLILGDGVTVCNAQLGRFNMLCDRSNITNASLGDYSYIGVGTKVSNATIGKFTSIGPNVLISLGMHPSRDFVSTHPVFYSTTFRCKNRFASEQGFVEHAPVTIGHDVWIGAGVMISDNVSIGTGAIVATGSVVNKDVEPYSVVGGTPAKLIRMRFEENQIQQLLDSKWWDRDDKWLAKNHKSLHNVESFIELIAKQEKQTS